MLVEELFYEDFTKEDYINFKSGDTISKDGTIGKIDSISLIAYDGNYIHDTESLYKMIDYIYDNAKDIAVHSLIEIYVETKLGNYEYWEINEVEEVTN